MSKTTKGLLAIIGLILATTAALAAMGAMDKTGSPPQPLIAPTADKILTLTTEVVQNKILQGADGRVIVALNLVTARLPRPDNTAVQPADLVIVLDRSGSMEGQKLNDARQAVIGLLDQLGPDDRLALVSYADDVQTQSPLIPIDATNHRRLRSIVAQVRAGGGTNLGGGLNRGIELLANSADVERQRKVILISDGLANQGITDPAALGRMASTAVENRFSISTVGVGLDFNEMLVTAIADQGAGQYHFLENPNVFARVFEQELQAARQVAAADVQIRIALEPGVQLVSAGGYPIRHENRTALIHPGGLLSGQERTLYLTFQVPTDVERDIVLGRVQASYRQHGKSHTVVASAPLTVVCVADPAAVLTSIKKEAWADQVVQEEFSRLKEEIAADIRDNEPERAHTRIQEYETRQAAINASVGSAKVAENLDSDVQALRQELDETFAGAPAAVAEKKKQASKSLQYDSYQLRRDKK